MPKRKVTTVVTIEVRLKVPYKKTPGHMLQFVTQALEAFSPGESNRPEVWKVQLIKKETNYA